MSVGRVRDAQEENLIAYQLDPLHPGTNSTLAAVYLSLGDDQNALKYGIAAWDLGHPFGLVAQAEANRRLGNIDRAMEFAEQLGEQITEQFGDPTFSSGPKLLLQAKEGDAAKRSLYLQMLAENESVMPLLVVLPGYAILDRIDDAYRLVDLAQGLIDGNDWRMFWRGDMAAFRQDARFAELVKQGGLVDYWREHGWPDYCQPVGDSVTCQ
jgi:tetratricopeptide (TPR) repeat protein